MKKIISCIFVLLFGIVQSFGQNLTAKSLDTFIANLSARGQFNGSILVADKKSIIYKQALGYADFDKKIPFKISTPSCIASLTKQFTSMAIMILSERQKLSYDDDLTKWYPEFKKFKYKITIRNLLTHTSGVPNYFSLGMVHSGLTNIEVLENLLKLDSLNFEPGSKYSYGDSGYTLLAFIIEKVSGLSYHDFLTKNIFRPLKMKNTFVFDSIHSQSKNVAHGYSRFEDNADYDLLTYGGGGIYSTVEDMYKWHIALFTNKLVKQSTMKLAFLKPALSDNTLSNYGFGWGIDEFEGKATVTHYGRYGGFNSYIKRFLNEGLLVVFLTNADFKNLNAVGNPVLNILFHTGESSFPKISVANSMNKIYKTNGLNASLQFYDSLSTSKTTDYDFDESELKEWGYYLLSHKKTNDAFEVLMKNVELFPNSSITNDSFGEINMILGRKEQAILYYKKSVELNPKNTGAISALKKLMSQN